MKHIRTLGTAVAVAGMVFGGFAPAFAETTATSSLNAIIQSLQSQLTTLRAQVEAARSAQANARTTAGEIRDTLKLISQLRTGASGEDVALLQTILAANPDIYPEGRITGFFGPATEKAVRRFQKMHGLEQAGRVGPRTLEKLNEELERHPLMREMRATSTRPCAIVPPGHLIAPGWLRKNAAPIVPLCQTLPHGIMMKFASSTATSTTTSTTQH